jgi:hypothetical protein
VATFASLSLKRRATAALNVIDANPGLSIAERSELVCVAIWPVDIELPGPVSRDALLEPDVDQRPTPPPAVPAVRAWTPEQRAEARAAFQGGATISALSERYAQPWLVVRKWVRATR